MTTVKFEAKIGRGEPMPSICKLCSSFHKCKGEVSDVPQENSCFEEKWLPNGISDETRERLLAYKPFVNSKRTVQKICDNFSHVRSHVIRYR